MASDNFLACRGGMFGTPTADMPGKCSERPTNLVGSHHAVRAIDVFVLAGSWWIPMAGFLDLTGQVALLTGAGQGIRVGIARRLHAAGARIADFDKDRAHVESAAAELDGPAIAGDACSENQVAAAVRRTEEALGPRDRAGRDRDANARRPRTVDSRVHDCKDPDRLDRNH